VLERLKDRPDGKLIESPRSRDAVAREIDDNDRSSSGLGKRGKKVVACIRQPSGGPTMNIKVGGRRRLSQCIPLTEFSLGLTGDINPS